MLKQKETIVRGITFSLFFKVHRSDVNCTGKHFSQEK